MPGRASTILLALLFLGSASAFSRTSIMAAKSALHSSVSFDQEAMMGKARDCAFSETCSIEESREHLHDLQVAGSVHDEAAEIVGRLRDRIRSGEQALAARPTSRSMGAGLFPMMMAFLALACIHTIVVVNANPDVAPFTMEEVGYAVRDGYLDDLVVHFLKNGGLLVGDNHYASVTMQEVWWAAQGGYLGDLVSHVLRNGGL